MHFVKYTSIGQVYEHVRVWRAGPEAQLKARLQAFTFGTGVNTFALDLIKQPCSSEVY